MERNEMIETLMKKANVGHAEAEEALEKCNWDLLDSVIYLERRREQNQQIATRIETKEEEGKKDHSQKQDDKCGGIGDAIGRIFKFIGKCIKKGNENFFEVRKENEKPIRVSLTISVILLIFLTIPIAVLLIIGLFCGYKYSISGTNVNYHGVNTVFEEVAKSADNIKKDFKEGYEK